MSNSTPTSARSYTTLGSRSRSSSCTLVTPTIKSAVGDITAKLIEIDSIIDDIDDEPVAAPDIKDLFKEISSLGEDINKIKLRQTAQIQTIKTDVGENTKKQIFESAKTRIDSLIADAVAAKVKEEVAGWAGRPRVKGFVEELRSTSNESNILLGETNVCLENLLARHANSTLDMEDDLNSRLRPIKRQGGYISELFPINLRELFSYDAKRLVQLIEDYGLQPLEGHCENLTRFLTFIGVDASVPDQPVRFLEEQLPAYGNIAETKDEKTLQGHRRRFSAPHDIKQNHGMRS